MRKNIVACIDGSEFSQAVCDAALWSQERLSAPLHLLYVNETSSLDAVKETVSDATPEPHQKIQNELNELEGKKLELLRERGKAILKKSGDYISDNGFDDLKLKQQTGVLEQVVEEMEDDIRLLILGKGRSDVSQQGVLGSHIESIIRTLRRPMLIVTEVFVRPKRILMAFDGSATTAKGVQLIADSPMFNGIECHVVQVGADTDEHREQLKWAENTLEDSDVPTVTQLLVTNDIDASLTAYADEHDIDMIVMGAYSHSRLRQMLLGSSTTRILRNSKRTLLVLR